MGDVNRSRLFAASCIALLVTAMTFAFLARLETVFGPAGVGLTLEQIGYAFMPAFWGFTIAMVVGGPIVDLLGIFSVSLVLPVMGRIMDGSPGSSAIRVMSTLPAVLVILYGGLFLLRRRRKFAGASA